MVIQKQMRQKKLLKQFDDEEKKTMFNLWSDFE